MELHGMGSGMDSGLVCKSIQQITVFAAFALFLHQLDY